MVDWLNQSGGMAWSEARCRESSSSIYSWAEASEHADPFVKTESQRSSVVCTIDLQGVDADDVSNTLRANGIVDTESYRKLGRNQLRLATFPAIEPTDVVLLCQSIDYIIERLLP
jgi:phosphoserine aminotransferase